MINIIIPLAGAAPNFQEDGRSFPKPLHEVKGLPMIQRSLQTFETIRERKRFIFIVKRAHCSKFHLDNTLRHLGGADCGIIVQENDAKGAACSVLLAIDSIANEDSLIISNGDQVIETDLQRVLDDFRAHNAAAGVLCFPSVHPQWSYAKIGSDGNVTEVAEKNPISRNAIAGFYYFERGHGFIEAAQRMILKCDTVNDLYYIAPSLNEVILSGQAVRTAMIEAAQYHSFYSLDRIREYEKNSA